MRRVHFVLTLYFLLLCPATIMTAAQLLRGSPKLVSLHSDIISLHSDIMRGVERASAGVDSNSSPSGDGPENDFFSRALHAHRTPYHNHRRQQHELPSDKKADRQMRSLGDIHIYYFTQSTQTAQEVASQSTETAQVVETTETVQVLETTETVQASALQSSELTVQNEQVGLSDDTDYYYQVPGTAQSTETVQVLEWPPPPPPPVAIKCGTFALGMYWYLDVGFCYNLAGNWWNHKITWTRGESAGGACIEVWDETSGEKYCGNEWAQLTDPSMQVSRVCCLLQE